jgi:hypothetical protein
MADSDILTALQPVVAALDEMGVAYEIGGSVASSACGVPRTTLDVDLVAALGREHVKELVDRLQSLYYVDENAAFEAVERQSSFNLIHLGTMLKVDVFVLKSRAYDQSAFRRKRKDRLSLDPAGNSFYFASPEDVVLNKLEWFRLGRELSERQWNDVAGVLKVQQGALDIVYMRHWAGVLGIMDLLERAFREAGVPLPKL